MAYEDLIAGRGWTNLPTPQFGGGLLSAPDVNRYQQIMSQMQQFNQPVPQGLLDASGGYNNELYDLTSQQGSAINSFNEAINQRIGGSNTAVASMAAQKAAADAAFAQLTPGEQAAVKAMEGPQLLNLLLPFPVPMLLDAMGMTPGATSSGGVSSTSGSPMAGIASKGNVGQVANVTTTAQNAANAAVAAGVGGISSSSGTVGGGLAGRGSGALGLANTVAATTAPKGDVFAPMNLNQIANLSSGNAGNAVSAPSGLSGVGTGASGVTASGGNASSAAAAASAAASAAAASAASGGTSSGTSSSGIGGVGTGASGVAATASATGGGGGGGGGCCFIMLEARYGDGTMDRVVRRYRDEKVTERNKRGYYKLAEVFIPLMRKSKLFSFFVVKTFADPAVCYAKWYYGENKWGWIFKPLEKFWMSLFDTLGTDTKFIRENGETV